MIDLLLVGKKDVLIKEHAGVRRVGPPLRGWENCNGSTGQRCGRGAGRRITRGLGSRDRQITQSRPATPPAPTLSAISHPCRRWSFSIALEKLPAFSTALHVEAERSLDALMK